MESATTRPSIDLEPSNARPGLALALGVLSLPGSTLAWDLPAGGLWIGLPLAIAAIVVGLDARKKLAGGAGRTMATIGIVLAGLMILQMAAFFAVG